MAGWIKGASVSPDEASQSIADMLAASKSPLIVVDAIDLSGAASVVNFARKLSARLDHKQPSGLAPLQEHGYLGTTPGVAAREADTIVFVGPLPGDITNDPGVQNIAKVRPGRAVLTLGDGGAQIANAEHVAIDNIPLHAFIGLMRALASDKPTSAAAAEGVETAKALLERMKAAKYGTFVFAQGQIDRLALLGLMALADALSADNRWTLLPVSTPPGQSELLRMSVALTGLPVPLAFSGQRATHDPWLNGARNVTTRGEADTVLWVSAAESPAPDWLTNNNTVLALSASRSALSSVAAQLEVGVSGIDHAGLIDNPGVGTFTVRAGGMNRDSWSNGARPPVARVLSELDGRIS